MDIKSTKPVLLADMTHIFSSVIIAFKNQKYYILK